jgi:hypothetical protein
MPPCRPAASVEFFPGDFGNPLFLFVPYFSRFSRALDDMSPTPQKGSVVVVFFLLLLLLVVWIVFPPSFTSPE